MSNTFNPYESTQTNIDEQKPNVAQGFFTASMIAHLKAASPWMKFMAIISFIGAGLSIVIGIVMRIMLPFLIDESDLSDFFFGEMLNVSLAITYIISGIFLIFPAIFLYKFASKIKSFLKTKNVRDMEIAFRNNKSFWKFHGILLIICLAFIPLMFFVSIFITIGSYF
jgi:hypothetical protein